MFSDIQFDSRLEEKYMDVDKDFFLLLSSLYASIHCNTAVDSACFAAIWECDSTTAMCTCDAFCEAVCGQDDSYGSDFSQYARESVISAVSLIRSLRDAKDMRDSDAVRRTCIGADAVPMLSCIFRHSEVVTVEINRTWNSGDSARKGGPYVMIVPTSNGTQLHIPKYQIVNTRTLRKSAIRYLNFPESLAPLLYGLFEAIYSEMQPLYTTVGNYFIDGVEHSRNYTQAVYSDALKHVSRLQMPSDKSYAAMLFMESRYARS